MAKLQNYRVRRGHVHAPRVRAVEGDVLPLDPLSPKVVQFVAAGLLVPTSAEPEGQLVEMLRSRYSWEKTRPRSTADGAREQEVNIEGMAAELVAFSVDDMEKALPTVPAEVLMAAGEKESAKDKPRKGALEALAGELADRAERAAEAEAEAARAAETK